MIRRLLAGLALAAAAALVPATALACGAFYADDVKVSPEQKIVVVHRAGTETYVFRPHFCGSAKDFGVILPIPAALSTNPTLASNDLFDQLDDYTKPETVEVCQTGGGFGCAGDSKLGGYDNTQFMPDAGTDVNVVERGRVGAFEYALLQATTAAAFTDWLDQNGFPHGTGGTGPYEYYVAKQWYFVAFKVSADTSAPPAGKQLCGDLGPIQLSFPAAQPVVPARIAAINFSQSGAAPTWRVFVVATGQQALSLQASKSNYSANLYFAGDVTKAKLASQPKVADLVQDGERLTVQDVAFPYEGAADDITFESGSPYDHRAQIHVTVDCGPGCTTGGSMATDVVAVVLIFGVLAVLHVRRRRA